MVQNSTICNNIAESKTLNAPVGGHDGQTVVVKQFGQGGGLYNSGTAVITDGSTFSGNYANHGGGVASVYASVASSLSLVETTFVDNRAKEFGGAIYSGAMSSTTLSRSVVQGNQSELRGGGLYGESTFSSDNTIFSGNKATDSGGAIAFVAGAYELTLLNVTITGNSAGKGAGILATGQNSILFVGNSLVVNNRDEDGNLADIFNQGTIRGLSTLSSFTAWSESTLCAIDDPITPLFVRDYDFDTMTQGDYRLVYGSDSPAIDKGTDASVYSALDLDGYSRIAGASVDLGAYEYQPTIFESAFPADLSVRQGCSFHLCSLGTTDANGNAITQYSVDLDGDGASDRTGSSLWISWKELSRRSEGKGYFWLTVKNELGEMSAPGIISVNILEVLPTIEVGQVTFPGDQILKLCLNVHYYERCVSQWTINWGDGSEESVYNDCASYLTCAHFYGDAPGVYPITLTLVDSSGHGGDIAYSIGTHPVAGSPINATEIALSSLPGEQLSFSLEKNDELFLSSEICDTTLGLFILENALPAEPICVAPSFVDQWNDRALWPGKGFLSAKSEFFARRPEILSTGFVCRSITNNALSPMTSSAAEWKSLWEEDCPFLDERDTRLTYPWNLKTALDREVFTDDALDELLTPYFE